MTNDMLKDLFDKQIQIQTLAYGKDPRDITDPVERIQFIKDMTQALTMELGEMLEETGWKPWASSNHVNEQAGQGEQADIFLFFINLVLAFGGDAESLYAKTMAKMDRNLARQLEGYDGIKGKCLSCGRALDDPAVTCVEYDDNSTFYGWCGKIKTDSPASVIGFFNPEAAENVQ